MENSIQAFLKIIFSGLASVAAFIWGPANEWLYTLIVMIVFDYITGIIAAALHHELSSAAGRREILKKALFLIVVGVGHLADMLIGLDGIGRTAVIGFLIANEALSILENCERCGLKKPAALISLLKQINRSDQDDDKQ